MWNSSAVCVPSVWTALSASGQIIAVHVVWTFGTCPGKEPSITSRQHHSQYTALMTICWFQGLWLILGKLFQPPLVWSLFVFLASCFYFRSAIISCLFPPLSCHEFSHRCYSPAALHLGDAASCNNVFLPNPHTAVFPVCCSVGAFKVLPLILSGSNNPAVCFAALTF